MCRLVFGLNDRAGGEHVVNVEVALSVPHVGCVGTLVSEVVRKLILVVAVLQDRPSDPLEVVGVYGEVLRFGLTSLPIEQHERQVFV